MKIVNCQVNHLNHPLGFELGEPKVSWKVTDTASKKQIAAQVRISLDANFDEIVYDTGKKDDLNSLGTALPFELKPRTRYFWHVTAWGNEGDSATSNVQWFESGKMDEAWVAKPIQPSWTDSDIHPYFRHDFHVAKEIKQARLYISGQGLFHAEINGNKVGNEYLTPYCTAQDAWIQYVRHDVTGSLSIGKNTIGVMSGNGWAKGDFGVLAGQNGYTDTFTLIAEIWVSYLDGTEEVILTNQDWKCHPSHVMESSIYHGEVIDQTKKIEQWSSPELDTSDWDIVRLVDSFDKTLLAERLSLPVIVKETIQPEQIKTNNEEVVLDMKQNMVGWLRFYVDEPEGTVITIDHGEVLQDGNFYRDNLRGAKAAFTYISDGTPQWVEPHFTFFGFRYARLTGFTNLQAAKFTACVVYSDLAETGRIVTSHEGVNQLFKNAMWSQKGNFLDVPTDCPQRDERLGWTGDIQVFNRTANYNMGTYAFLRKFLKDLAEEQHMQHGMVGSVVPSFLKEKSGIPSSVTGGAAGWSDAATIVPWNLYVQFGDPAILDLQYQSMKEWVDWVSLQVEQGENNHLWDTGFQFGDWLALDGPVKGGTEGGTDKTYIASMFYYQSTKILVKAAHVLGIDVTSYEQKLKMIRKDILDEYFTPNGRIALGTQTAYVLALEFEILEQEKRAKLVAGLVELLKENEWHLTTGFLGTPYLCNVLSKNGYSDASYRLLLQEGYPSWLYSVNMGATTIWERWNSILPDGKISGTGMNSLNHYSYGSIVGWMYEFMAGIKPVESEPGFQTFIIEPEINHRMSFVEAAFDSPKGLIRSEWQILSGDKVSLTIEVPFDTNATLRLTDVVSGTIQGIDKVSEQGNKVTCQLDAGIYHITYQSSVSLQKTFSLDSEVQDLLGHEEAKMIIMPIVQLASRIPGDMAKELEGSVTVNDYLDFLSPSIKKALESKVNLEEMNQRLANIK